MSLDRRSEEKGARVMEDSGPKTQTTRFESQDGVESPCFKEQRSATEQRFSDNDNTFKTIKNLS